MKILIVGNGGREHAICWKLKHDDPLVELFCAPGNGGTAALAENLPIRAEAAEALLAWAAEERPDLVVIGPEAPLCAGLADALIEQGLRVFGPRKAAARIEGSKRFAKEICGAAKVPTARSETVSTEPGAREALACFGLPVVLKADGLAAGKGVFVCQTAEDVEEALQALFTEHRFGKAGTDVLVEEYLKGEEVSLLAFVGGPDIVPMVPAQDHKRLRNGDEGPNTGGMGAYSPAPALSPALQKTVMERIVRPVVAELAARGIDYCGVLYAGLMITDKGPHVLEFNCRFGDPETQCVLPRLATPLLPILMACADGRLTSELVSWRKDPCVCVVMASGGYPDRYEKGLRISGIRDAEELPGVTVFHAGTALRHGSVHTDGGRVLGVAATAQDLAEAVRTAYHAVLRIKFDRAHYRTDIAQRALAISE